jgi:asparagine synthase (glutamine-hydrolysing)
MGSWVAVKVWGHRSDNTIAKFRDCHDKYLESEDSGIYYNGDYLVTRTQGGSSIVDGSLWFGESRLDNVEHILDTLQAAGGSFSGVLLIDDDLFGFRDPVGRVPLYYGVKEGLAVLASHKKLLWGIDLEPCTLSPGSVFSATIQDHRVEKVSEISQPRIRGTSLEDAVDSLDKVLIESVKKRVRGYSRVALGFSGGIDSSVLGYYLRESGVRVQLINVGLAGSKEFDIAMTAADFLGLDMTVIKHSVEDLETYIDRVLWIIEDPNPVKLAVAIPLYWAAEAVADMGVKAFFSGNGADELLGGYHRYLGRPMEKAAGMMFNDVKASHENNYERDYKVCSSHNIELKLPYADHRLIEYGLSLPVEYRVPMNPGEPRKVVLRHLARRLRFPEPLVDRRKRAVQYSTGVNKELLRFAKRKGVKLREYLMDRLELLKKEYL